MKIRVATLDLELTRRQKAAAILSLGLVVGGLGAAVATAVPKQWTAGEPLKAADLNANFADVEQQIADAAVTVTEWANYTPEVANNAGTPITIAAEPGAASIGQWRRVGDSIEIRVTARFPSCPLMNTNLTWSLPTGVEVDYAKTSPYAIVGSGFVVDGMTGASLFPPTEVGHPTNFPNRLFQPGTVAGATIHCNQINADGSVRFSAAFPVKTWTKSN
ncbi:MAG: hypothetical protein U0414_31320 [Polyangiaceae bacterium]